MQRQIKKPVSSQDKQAFSKNYAEDNIIFNNVKQPHSDEAEQSVLGGLMLDNSAWNRIAGRICEADFYRTEHKLIFRAISELSKSKKPFDMVTLCEVLKEHKAFNESYLFELANNTPTSANIDAYCDVVIERLKKKTNGENL